MSNLHKGDYGLDITLTVTDSAGSPIDISTASVKEIWLRGPRKRVQRKDADFTGDGTDGELSYTLQAGDLDRPGAWEAWAYVVVSGAGWRTEPLDFDVEGAA